MAIKFEAPILKFAEKGEKTGWTYIEIPIEIADALNPHVKKSYRVKGKLNNYLVKQVALIPMGGGLFIFPINAEMRKHLGKNKGDILSVELSLDTSEIKLNEDFLICLQDEPHAYKLFTSFSQSHQKYFNNYIETAKTDATRAKRIAQSLQALLVGMNFAEMIRAQKTLKS
jgi:hypothetical protein